MKRVAFTFLVGGLLAASLINACKNPAGPSNQMAFPPSRDLSPQEILGMEGIHSIHYTEYDSVVVNGHVYGPSTPSIEMYLDSTHKKVIQYHPLNITVYDLGEHLVWNYYDGQLTYPQLPNVQAAYDQDIQANCGSWLTGPYSLLQQEMLGDKLCDVFIDSAGRQEWVWIDHRLPIQRRRTGAYDNLYEITVTQKRGIEVNRHFPDSLFAPPRN
jgi:hypothetical protein